MLIRKKTDCALRCLAVLAEARGKHLVSVHQLVEQGDISEDLLHKIMQILGRAKLVRGTRGRTGGFRLAKSPEKITVLRIFEVLQGPFAVNRCLSKTNRGLSSKFVDIQEELLSVFRGTTLADLIIDSDDKQKRRTSRKHK